jgi:hypothetical protein
MSKQPIDATKIVLRTLRLLDDGRRAVGEQLEQLTKAVTTITPATDRRRPPEIW